MIPAFVINLDSRKDRLDTINLPLPFMRYPAVNGLNIPDVPVKLRGHIGCLRSHIGLLEDIKYHKLDYAIVFEDDVVVCDDFNNKVIDVMKQLPEDWDLLYLGGWNVEVQKSFTADLDYAEKVYTTHAYIIRGKFIDRALQSLKSRPYKVDVLLAEALPDGKCFICNPVLAWQRPGYSDIENKITDNKHLR